MNGVLYKYMYAINIWQTKYFQEIQKNKIRREKDVPRVTRKSAILTIKKMEILERSYICLQNVAKQSRY